MYMYIYIYTYIYIYINTHTYMYTHMYDVCICIYIYIYIHESYGDSTTISPTMISTESLILALSIFCTSTFQYMYF